MLSETRVLDALSIGKPFVVGALRRARLANEFEFMGSLPLALFILFGLEKQRFDDDSVELSKLTGLDWFDLI